MGKIYGYARISKPTQKIERQIENLQKVDSDIIIYEEVYTGRKIEGRKRFKQLLKVVKTGDTVVFDSVSRMSRNAEEGVKLYFELYEKGVKLVFLKEAYINTEVYEGALKRQHIELTGDKVDFILSGVNTYLKEVAKEQIQIAFNQAEKEVEDLRVRTSEGIREAKRKGKQVGQVKGAKLNIKKKAPAKEKIRKHSRDFDGTLTDKETMKLAGIANNTYYKYKKELLEELREQEEAG